MKARKPKTPPGDTATKPADHGATTGYEAELWRMADTLRGSMDAAEYKHVVLGLIFLKYISDAFEEIHARLESERAQGADPEDPDEYRAREHLLGTAGGPLGASQGPGEGNPPSARSSTTRWTGSSVTTRCSRTYCPRTTPAPRSTSSGLVNSSI